MTDRLRIPSYRQASRHASVGMLIVCGVVWTLVPVSLFAADGFQNIDRSPVDLVVTADQRFVITANQTSDTVSLVDLAAGRVLHEIQVGDRPSAIVLHPTQARVLVSCSNSGEIQVIDIVGDRLEPAFPIQVGFQPNGIAITPDGKMAYVALTDADRVAMVDLERREIVDQIPVGRWPRYLALSGDGSRLAVGTSGDRGISLVDTASRKLLHIDRFVGLNIGHMQVSRDGRHVYFPWMVYRRNPITEGNIRLGWVLATRLGRTSFDETGRRAAISLDPPGKAVADPHGIALTSDEQTLVIAASGTHELLVLGNQNLPFQENGSTDHIVPELLKDAKRFQRIELGGRPMGVRITPDDKTALVANYLDNSIQLVDLVERKVAGRIFLGGPQQPSLARRGEAIFYDGRRSLDQWYSCHSCHYEGGSNAVAMDTLNDGGARSYKTVLPLYDVHATGPWTWHGWQKDLDAAIVKSMTSTMLGPSPSDSDVQAMNAFLKSLTRAPNPHQNAPADEKLAASIERGRKQFQSEHAGCANCHSGEVFTDGKIHDVGLGNREDRYDGFNTPSLLGVFRKVRLLHDGRAESLEEVLTSYHSPATVSGTRDLTAEEVHDLVAYLKTL